MRPKGLEFLEKIQNSIVVGDGAFGTMLYAKGISPDACVEELCLTEPETIASILQDYKNVGAQVLETNSFCLNRHKLQKFNLSKKTREMALASAKIARSVAGQELFVAGSIGPIVRRKREMDEYTSDDLLKMFLEPMEAMVEGGIDLFILETFSRLSELEIGLKAALQFDVPVVCQMAFGEEGLTDSGITPEKAARRLTELGAHMVGANCQIGPKNIEIMIDRMSQSTHLPISVFPNAGYAQQIDGRYVYGATPDYFESQVPLLVEAGATMIGGCCGTAPEHIQAITKASKKLSPAKRKAVQKSPSTAIKEVVELSDRQRNFLNLMEGHSFVTVEVEPPRDFNLKNTFDGARVLASKGCDAFNVPDNPLAYVRMDNMVFANLLRQNVDIPVILHLTCRDKNMIALKSDLLGAEMIGIEAILAVTGDPAAIGDQPGATSVYDVNSIGLVEMIGAFNEGQKISKKADFRTRFAIGVAFNPNVSGEKGMEGAVFKLRKKIKAGAQFVETQPMFDAQLIPKLAKATKELGIPICMGLMPVISERNAEFLHNEVPGIKIPKDVRHRFSGLNKSEGEKEAIRFSEELIDVAWQNGIRRFYIVPPFSNYHLASELVQLIKTK